LKERWRWLAAGLFGIFALVTIASASWDNSPAWDEPEHILAGYTYLRYGVFLINPFHPPLVKDLSGLAVLALDPPLLLGWPTADKRVLIDELFSGRDPQALVRVARLPHIVLAAAFVSLYFLSIAERHGNRAAALATALLLMMPTFLGHAGLVHNDVAAAIFIYLSLWVLAGYLARPPTWSSLLAFALVAGVAQLVKFSCLILYPVYLMAISWRSDWRWQRWRGVPLTALVGLMVIWAVYIAHPAPSDFQRLYREQLFRGERSAVLDTLDRAGDIPYLRRLSWYATGLLAQSRHVAQGHDYPVFLGGRLYPKGTTLYFPAVWALKTPLAVWLLLALSLVGLRRSWDTESQLYALFGVCYLAVALGGSLNLGLRHLMPLFPILFAVAGRSLAEGWRTVQHRGYRLGVVLGLAGGLLTLALAWPNYLSYFNLLSPRPAPVVDSDYDWGTDLLRLARQANAEGWKPMTVHYFGNLHPRTYLGPGTALLDPKALPQSGWVAISATHYFPLMASAKTGPDPLVNWVQSLQKVGQVGTFLVFRIPEVTP
jgi:hypothetical protein